MGTPNCVPWPPATVARTPVESSAPGLRGLHRFHHRRTHEHVDDCRHAEDRGLAQLIIAPGMDMGVKESREKGLSPGVEDGAIPGIRGTGAD
jgi:hypothetical protein